MTAFVDWQAQMHNARVLDAPPAERAKRTLESTARVVGRSLKKHAPARFEVRFRIYHGWHKGWQPTENFRAIVTAVSDTDFAVAARASNVVCLPNVGYGHTLLSALPERAHSRPPIHLPNTLRRRDRQSDPEEKMVDTALAADLLEWARSGPAEWALILAEDDDVVPPVLTAESWIRPYGGRAFIVRAPRSGAFLKLDGLLMESSR